MSSEVFTANRGVEGNVLGKIRFDGDSRVFDCLHAAPIRAGIAFGRVVSLDCAAARELEGVVRVFTFHDVPAHKYTSSGHPWSMDPTFCNSPEKRIFTDEIKHYGDMMGCVVARSKETAIAAAQLVTAEYASFPPVRDSHAGTADGVSALHAEFADNACASFEDVVGTPPVTPPDRVFSGVFKTRIVPHDAPESHSATAWQDAEGVLTLVSATQAPHSVRRIVGEALNVPVHRIRVIKPAVGSAGARQELILEPAVAFLCLQLGGKPVRLAFERENTSTRHAAHMELTTGVDATGRLVTRELLNVCESGGHSGHGHLVCVLGGSVFRQFYEGQHVVVRGRTAFTNRPPAGSMGGHGVPQIVFALESHMDDIARQLDVDPVEFRLSNVREGGAVDPLSGVTVSTAGFSTCLERGKALCDWDNARRSLCGQTGPVRRGVGMAGFMYPTGTVPVCAETATARVTLQAGGTVLLDVGALDRGPGSGTVFAQMAAHALNIPVDAIHIAVEQDSFFPLSSLELGASTCRQSYVTGRAVKKVAHELREKILAFAARFMGVPLRELRLEAGSVLTPTGAVSLGEIVRVARQYAEFQDELAGGLSVQGSVACTDTAFAYGATFAEVEVNIPLCRVEVLDLYSVVDCGKLIEHIQPENVLLPQFLQSQVAQVLHGEQTSAIPRRASKRMTSANRPNFTGEFVETDEPTVPFDNKGLAEATTLSQAPAVRNAVLHATGVGVNSLPLSPQCLFSAFKQAGLIV